MRPTRVRDVRARGRPTRSALDDGPAVGPSLTSRRDRPIVIDQPIVGTAHPTAPDRQEGRGMTTHPPGLPLAPPFPAVSGRRQARGPGAGPDQRAFTVTPSTALADRGDERTWVVSDCCT